MQLINTSELKTTKRIKELIDNLQVQLLQTEDALEDVTRAAEIAQITGQVEMMEAFVSQANQILANRMVRPDSSIGADQHKITVVIDDSKDTVKNVT